MNTKRHGITFAAGCLLLVSALAVFLSGCALTVDKVKLDYVPQTGAQKVALKEPVRVDVGVVDIRSKKDRVSSKKNGYGMEMAAIVAENDVADVVANAIVAELRSRGFEIGQGHVIVNAELQKFYNDFKVGFFSGDAEAEVVINTKVRGVDKTVRFAKVVAGEGKEPNIQLSSGENAKLALDRALADAIARLFSDPAFVDALITAGPAPDPAATHGAESTINPTRPGGTSGLEAQLERLSSLRARGEITEDEYTILRKRVLDTPVPAPERTSSLKVPAPPMRSGAPGDLKWPPVNSRSVMSVRTSGSFGSGWHLQTIYFLGERDWQGRRAFAFGNGSVTTYVDARRRTLALVKSDALVESFEPYLVLADWPLVIGKRWPNRYRYNDHMRGRSFGDAQYDGKVEAYEDVKTPAGTFKAFRIHLEGVSSNYILWYSGDLGLFIKTRNERFANHYLGSGVREAELVSYSDSEK